MENLSSFLRKAVLFTGLFSLAVLLGLESGQTLPPGIPWWLWPMGTLLLSPIAIVISWESPKALPLPIILFGGIAGMVVAQAACWWGTPLSFLGAVAVFSVLVWTSLVVFIWPKAFINHPAALIVAAISVAVIAWSSLGMSIIPNGFPGAGRLPSYWWLIACVVAGHAAYRWLGGLEEDGENSWNEAFRFSCGFFYYVLSALCFIGELIIYSDELVD